MILIQKNAMPTPNTTITDSKFNALKVKLRELFELDKSDLDFGIYRIIAAKNKEVTEFLDRQLKDVVRGTLAAHGAGAADQVQVDLDKAIAQARDLGVDPETSQKVKDLRARLESAGGAASADLEADIYNHLLAFFGRYYDEGDFISQRRYKGDTYAIPYSGEEVTLHWANKDQYYIKSGEWHKDYRFRIGDKTVRFKLVDATQEVGNNKEADDAKRRYILVAESPVEESASELALRFEFRAPKLADIERAAAGAVAIFGGDFAKPNNPKKGDEREQFCADAEKRSLVAMSAAWKGVATAASPTEGKPARTILGKHLDDFTARNTFDYFIHKDLGGFLGRELDFYIKNEVVRLDDLEALPPNHLHRIQGKVKAIRAVASRVIAFLGSLENFQKKMWLKKKFVLNTNWLVTVDRIPARLRDVVAANTEQWAEWERLGFKPGANGNDGLFGGATWGSRAYLDACDKLVVDTRFFERSFVADIAASEDLLVGTSVIDDATLGLLVHGENAQALGTLKATLRRRVQTVYIDPPYNTVHSKIIYKNQFEHASWLSLMQNTLEIVPAFWADQYSFGLAIDDFEYTRLTMLLRSVFPASEHTTIVVNHHPQGSGGRLSRTHEYFILVSDPDSPAYLGKPVPDETEDRSFMRSGTAENNFRYGRQNSFYALLYDVQHRRFVGTEHPPEGADYPTGDTPEGYKRVYPIDSQRQERVWRSAFETGTTRVKNNELFMTPRGAVKQRIDHEAKREVLFSNWVGSEFNAGTHGTAALDALGLGGEFDYPKSVKQLELALWTQSFGDTNRIVMDYFAGSGTTAHAVVNLNREDDGTRRFVLAEVGKHFETVIKPRVAKVIYSPDWASGKAQSHDKGVSALVKYFALESYEDALNNLPAPSGQLLDGRSEAERDALVTYALDLELGPRLLDLDAFRDPWGYTIKAQLAGDAEIKRHRVDLVETFNYLIGLKVHAYGPLERYSADFERAAHADSLGRIKITGRLRRDPSGPFVFQRVEGELNDGNATRVLVVWRKLTDDPEKDAAALDAWMARHRETTRERTEHRDYHLIYINGPVTLPQPTAEIRTVFPTEEAFKVKMFEDTDSASSTGGANG